jgi:cobalt-zinc-cadmium efflux system protein
MTEGHTSSSPSDVHPTESGEITPAPSHGGPRRHDHDHDSGHDHSHDSIRGLTWTLILITGYMVAEFIGGWWTGSLALMADAAHMLSDAAALGISLWAARLVRAAASGQQTFGYHRAEVLAALANGATLFAVAGGISIEAWERLTSPTAINAVGMLVIAVGGLVVNLVALMFLHGGHQHDMNTRGAWLHVIGDTLGSAAVIVGAIVVWTTGQVWIDPAVSVLVSVMLLYSAWSLMTQAIRVLMEHAPSDIEVAAIESTIRAHQHVVDVHCLHVWTLGSGKHALSAHVVVEQDSDATVVCSGVQREIVEHFPIGHLTIQIEKPGMTCFGRTPCVGPACREFV